MKWEEIENYTRLPVSESWFAFLWFSSVKGLRAHPLYCQPTLIIFRYIQSDESHPNILWNAFKFDLVEPDRLSQLSHLTPSLVKIKGMQIKLHLQVSLLNFLTLRQKEQLRVAAFVFRIVILLPLQRTNHLKYTVHACLVTFFQFWDNLIGSNLIDLYEIWLGDCLWWKLWDNQQSFIRALAHWFLS